MASFALQSYPSRPSCHIGGVTSFQAQSLGLGWTSQFRGRVPFADCDPVGAQREHMDCPQAVALEIGKPVSSTGSVVRISNAHPLTKEFDEKAAKLHL